jgi:excisionase family DNA binding protein
VTAGAWIEDVIADLPELVTTDEARLALRMSRRHLYRQIAAGRLQAVRRGVGRRVLLPRAAIAAYLRQMEAT